MKQKHDKELTAVQNQLDVYTASESQLNQMQKSIEERVQYALSMQSRITNTITEGGSVHSILTSSKFPLHVLQSIHAIEDTYSDKKKLKLTLGIIDNYAQNITSQQSKVNIQLQECQRNIRSLTQDKEQITQKQTSMETQKILLLQQKKTILHRVHEEKYCFLIIGTC